MAYLNDMRRLIFLVVLSLAFVNSSFAQEDDDRLSVTWEGGEEDPLSRRHLFVAGLTYLHPKQLNTSLFGGAGFTQLYTLGYTLNFSIEPEYDPEEGGIPGVDLSVSMNWFLPEEKQGTFPDSALTNYRLRGWELMTNFIGLNLVGGEHFDVVTGLGWYFGNLKLRATNLYGQTDPKLYTNPFVAPMFRTELRCNFSILSFGVRGSYRFDISKDNWHRKANGLEPLPGYRFREFQALFFIGFRFVDT